MKRYYRIIVPVVTAVLLVTVGLFILIEYRIKSVRDELSVFTANTLASSAATVGIDEAMAQYKISYDDIVNFKYDDEGNIKSISTDVITLNNLGNQIGCLIDKEINFVSSHEIKLPITSLLGGEILSGVGPKIPLHITLTGITSTKFNNNFESAGINQTRHQIMLEVTVKSYVINGSEVKIVPYQTNVCIAESVIVGITPQTFAEISR